MLYLVYQLFWHFARLLTILLWATKVSSGYLIIGISRSIGLAPRKMEDVALEIHLILRLHETSIIERHIARTTGYDHISDEDKSKLKGLIEEMLGFAGRGPSRIAALRAICTLVVEEPFVRVLLKDCEKTLDNVLVLAERESEPETGAQSWASAVVNLKVGEHDRVHHLWSDIISIPVSLDDMDLLRKYAMSEEDIITGSSSDNMKHLADSFKHAGTKYISNTYLEIATKLAKNGPHEQYVWAIGHRILSFSTRMSSVKDKAAVNTKLELCQKLLKYATFSVTATFTIKTIIVIVLQDLNFRNAIKDDKEINHALSGMQNGPEQDGKFMEWLSSARDIIDGKDSNIFYQWAKFLADYESTAATTQALPDDTARVLVADKAVEAANAVPPNTSDVRGHFFVELYPVWEKVNLRSERASSESRIHELLPHSSTLEKGFCKECQKTHTQYHTSSQKLLEYVLKSAPDGSLVDLSSQLKDSLKKGVMKIGEGGFATVSKVEMEVKGKAVAIKLLRLTYEQALQCKEEFVVRSFARELRVMARLAHPNVMRLFGYALETSNHYYFALEWMEKGTLLQRMNGLSIVERFIMSLGIAEGMCYLHSGGVNVVHGDLKTPNVLISSSNEPILADFGLARMTESLTSKGYYSTMTARASHRWVPHDYYKVPDQSVFRPNLKSDVWTFGMTLLELVTGKHPYAEIKGDGGVARAIMEGRLPTKEKYKESDPDKRLKDDMWDLCHKCWVLKQNKRPTMHIVQQELIKIMYYHGIGQHYPGVRDSGIANAATA